MASEAEVFNKLIGATAKVFKIEPESIGADTDYQIDLGAKSLQFNAVIAWMEVEYDVEVSFAEFRSRGTVGKCAEYVLSLL